ncbi:EF-hand domain-containing protein [Allorhizobium terrae]|uniref:EF-hand domain-containing protein n=1 Tax=Allorhizobium terrae TaxID=1848972 RepID=A0A4S4A3H7_9HYPH|nr:hypothetical protein [Allorhizobium terrae]THF52482.1 hypothetical protein E6C51_06770 [Allorhizobium terrae]TWD57283.1 EF hand domain-containing protein [Agrobacterium vitis]
MTSVSSAVGSKLAERSSRASALDTNGDGVVSAAERPASTRRQNPTVSSDNAAASAVSQLSNNVMAMIMTKGEAHFAGGEEQKRNAQAIDADGKGKVSEKDFSQARPDNASQADASKQIDEFDKGDEGDALDVNDVLYQMTSVIAAYRAVTGTTDEKGMAKATLAQISTTPQRTIIV